MFLYKMESKMERKMELIKGFEGHISADFNFNIIDLLKCHFRVYAFAVLSFRPDMIIIQTMIKPYPVPNANTKGICTTVIPLSSLKEYDFDCPIDEVSVIINSTLVSGLPSGTKIGCINVVKDEPFRFLGESLYESDIGSSSDSDSDSDSPRHKALDDCCYDKSSIRYEEAVEVSFDIVHNKEGIRLKTDKLIHLGIHVNEPYPHSSIKSRLFYFIQEDFVNNLLSPSEIKSMLVSDIKQFKNCLSCSSRIKARKGGSIIFYCKESGVRSIIMGNDSNLSSKFEVPIYPFRGLFNFIRSSKAKYEILWTEKPDFIIRHAHYSTYAAFDRVIDCYPKE